MTTTHFRINFDWFTDYVRSLWAEGEYALAKELLTNDCGIPVNEAYDIIRGKRRMAQDPEGPEGAAGEIIDDNWEPDLGLCYMAIYPDPLNYQWFKLITRYGTKGLSELKRKAEWACEAMNNSTYSLDKIEILKRAEEVPKEIYEYFKLPDPKTINTGDLYPPKELELNSFDASRREAASQIRAERLNPVPGVPDIDTFIRRQIELDKAPKPKPDKDFSKPLGWILPNGKFYSCEWMEHIWLADAIAGKTKEQAVKTGWIEITHPINQPRSLQIIYGDKEPTQKQIDTLFEWQKKYTGEVINPSGEW